MIWWGRYYFGVGAILAFLIGILGLTWASLAPDSEFPYSQPKPRWRVILESVSKIVEAFIVYKLIFSGGNK